MGRPRTETDAVRVDVGHVLDPHRAGGGTPLTTTPLSRHVALVAGATRGRAAASPSRSAPPAPRSRRSRRPPLRVEVTDGDEATVELFPDGHRGSLFYDLARSSVIRPARAQAAELRPHGVAAVALTPGFLRSEEVLDSFGVTEGGGHFRAEVLPRLPEIMAGLTGD